LRRTLLAKRAAMTGSAATARTLSWAATPGIPLYALAALQNSTGVEMVQVSYRDNAHGFGEVRCGHDSACDGAVQATSAPARLTEVPERRRSITLRLPQRKQHLHGVEKLGSISGTGLWLRPLATSHDTLLQLSQARCYQRWPFASDGLAH
jgi:hypothetical protein